MFSSNHNDHTMQADGTSQPGSTRAKGRYPTLVSGGQCMAQLSPAKVCTEGDAKRSSKMHVAQSPIKPGLKKILKRVPAIRQAVIHKPPQLGATHTDLSSAMQNNPMYQSIGGGTATGNAVRTSRNSRSPTTDLKAREMVSRLPKYQSIYGMTPKPFEGSSGQHYLPNLMPTAGGSPLPDASFLTVTPVRVPRDPEP